MLRRAGTCMILVTGIMLLVFGACAPKDDERALQELVEKAARLAEKHNIRGIMDLTTDDFEARPGKVGRQECKRILFITFRHYGNLKVLHPRPTVDLEDESSRASVSFPFLMVKKDHPIPDLKELYNDPEGWVEKMIEKADLYHMGLKVRKVEGKWLVKEAFVDKYTGKNFLYE